jgi:hypothetical protein
MKDAESRAWAISLFANARIPDLRNIKRLIAMAAAALKLNGGTIAEVFNNKRERDAAYDFVENKRLSAEAIHHAAAVATAREMAREPFAWFPVDGSSLTYPDSHKTKGMGRLGSGKKAGKGIKVITSVVIDSEGVPRGVGEFKYWTRTGQPNKLGRGKVRVPNGKRKTSDKETQRWIDAIEDTRKIWQQHAPAVKRWWLIDREADSITLLHHTASGHQDLYTIRSNVNRRLIPKSSGGFASVRQAIDAQPVVDEYVLSVPSGRKRRARQALMQVRTARVTLDMRENWSKKARPLTVNVVRVEEVETTPDGEEPIKWVLYTNHPVDSLEDLHLVIYSYTQRWRVEDFHRTWKSGACRVEDMRLGSVAATKIWATILAPVAIRIERLKLLARTSPQSPADEEISPYELRAIRALKREEGVIVPPKLTVEEAVHFIAEIGGYTGPSSGGPPGTKTIARGLERVQLVAIGMWLDEQQPPEPTRRKRVTKRRSTQ